MYLLLQRTENAGKPDEQCAIFEVETERLTEFGPRSEIIDAFALALAGKEPAWSNADPPPADEVRATRPKGQEMAARAEIVRRWAEENGDGGVYLSEGSAVLRVDTQGANLTITELLCLSTLAHKLAMVAQAGRGPLANRLAHEAETISQVTGMLADKLTADPPPPGRGEIHINIAPSDIYPMEGGDS